MELFHWPSFTRPEPIHVADPVLVNKLCEQAVRIASLEAVIEQQRLHPRRNGRFVNRQDATTERLRGELAAKANQPLEEALANARAETEDAFSKAVRLGAWDGMKVKRG